jgi:peptidoglycan/LPS O-acetylase OafA/YrhL
MASQAPSRQFPLVQALRAIAAFSVALTHILYDALGMAPGAGRVRDMYQAMPWGAGVDIFFVISGFVIVHSSRRLFTAPGAMRLFAVRRLARIVPLYWVMTSLFVAEAFLDPGAVNGAIGGAAFIIKSYFFIPCARPDGVVQPVLGLGWTLNYEMFFYTVFLPFLFLRLERAVATVTILLAAFVLAGQGGLLQGVILQTWSNPIVLEFCGGMLLALLPGRLTTHGALRLATAIGALILLHLQPAGWNRTLAYGIPAAALVFAAVTGKQAGKLPKVEIWLVRLGDASYALYLVHPFVMRAVALLWQHAHRPGGIYAYILICLAISQLAAIAIHHLFERPITAWLRLKLEPQADRPGKPA